MITLRDRLLVFWAQNPDVPLTYPEIARKWSVTQICAAHAVDGLRRDRLVVSSRAGVAGPGNRLTVHAPAPDFEDLAYLL